MLLVTRSMTRLALASIALVSLVSLVWLGSGRASAGGAEDEQGAIQVEVLARLEQRWLAPSRDPTTATGQFGSARRTAKPPGRS